MEILDALKLLDLDASADWEDIQQSYRDMVKVWHPDRYQHDARLSEKALERTKQINLGYQAIVALGKEGFIAWRNEHQQPRSKIEPTPRSIPKQQEKSSPRTEKRRKLGFAPILFVIVLGLVSLRASFRYDTSRQRATELTKRGFQRYSEGHFAEALGIFQQAIDINPKVGEAHAGLASALIAVHKNNPDHKKRAEAFKQAQKEVELSLSLMPAPHDQGDER